MISINIEISPIKEVNTSVYAPPSKSYTHRYLFLSLLSKGINMVYNPLISTDTEASINAVNMFGGVVKLPEIHGIGKPIQPKNIVHCIRSGTTARISIGVASLVNGETIIDGEPQLRRRPMKDLLKSLEEIGVRTISRDYKLPVKIYGGRIRKKYVKISGDISSQYITSLLIMGTKIGLTVEVINDVVSRGYIDITVRCLREYGVKIYREGYRYFHVEESELSIGERRIPGDYSSAAYLMLIGALGGSIKIKGLDKVDPHPDKKFIDILRDAGATVHWNKDELNVEKGFLEGFEADLRDSPDLLPPTAVLAAYSKGTSVIRGVYHTKFKETDRRYTTIYNLRRMGIEVYGEDDMIIIKGGRPRNGVFNSFGDHRIALAFITASLFLDKPSKILNTEVISDSYPTFLNLVKGLGVEVNMFAG